MSDWIRRSIRDLAGTLISGSRPVGGVGAVVEGVPSLGGENIRTSGGVSYETIRRIPERFFSLLPKGRLQAADVLINKDGAQTGKVGLYDGRYEKAAINEHLFILRSNSGVIDQRLLYYYLLLPETQTDIGRRITGSAQPGLNSQFASAVWLNIPSGRQEQSCIAQVLASLDEAIEQSETLIAKMQQVKAGMMHDVFARGILPNGELRPPRHEAPRLYKESPLGWIPKEWEVVRLRELCSQVADCPHSTPAYVEHGIPCIRTADMIPGELLIDGALRVSEKTYLDRVARLVPAVGDIIYSREGERLGIASPVGEERVCLGQRVMLLRPSRGTDPDFMLWAMNAPSFYRRVASGLGATTSPHVNVGDVIQQSIVRPYSDEQEMIGRQLSALSSLVRKERAVLKSCSATKSGLMHDLLTGRVRIPESMLKRAAAAT